MGTLVYTGRLSAFFYYYHIIDYKLLIPPFAMQDIEAMPLYTKTTFLLFSFFCLRLQQSR